MSILIEGMEMPKVGIKIITIYADGKVLYDGDYIKAVSVQEPHGRLIDADALLKKCEFVCTDDDVDIRAVRYNVIDAEPTVIPASKEE